MSMRYEVNQFYPFIFFHGRYFSDRTENDPFIMSYTGSELTKHVELKILKCIEHHKVRGDYDKEDMEPQYDGFVFLDQEGIRWYNQYPRASYGQTNDAANGVVHVSDFDFAEGGYKDKKLPCYGFHLAIQYSNLIPFNPEKIPDLTWDGAELLAILEKMIQDNNMIIEKETMKHSDGTLATWKNGQVVEYVSRIKVPQSMEW